MTRSLAAALAFSLIPANAQRSASTTLAPGEVSGQAAAEGAAIASMVRTLWPAGVIGEQAHPGAWAYEVGTLLDGMAAQYEVKKRPADLAYIKAAVDRWVDKDGKISILPGKPFDAAQHTLDNLEPGRAVLFCYRVTGGPRYAKAAKFLIGQFADQPRTPEGGFWHKQVYPQQMWLDGAYMAEPFRAGYAQTSQQNGDFDDIAKQLLLMTEHMRDPQSGLLRHGWDSSHQAQWANKQTGLSPESWARAMGWYAMALVDTLPWFPQDHPDRARLIGALLEVADSVSRYQDHETGLWWDVLDKGTQPGNFREASASAMFVYAFAKGVRLGYLPRAKYEPVAFRGWNGLETRFVEHGANHQITLHGTVKVSGLGGIPYRSGDYSYYVQEPVGDNDPKGVGAFLLAASELEQLGHRTNR